MPYRITLRENGVAMCFYAYKQSAKYVTPIWQPLNNDKLKYTVKLTK